MKALKPVLATTMMSVMAAGTWVLAAEKKTNRKKPETVQVTIGSARYDVPKSWKEQPGGRRFRVAQYALPLAKGDRGEAELVVFFFGKGQGGGVQANLDRWKGQFRDRENKDTVDRIKAGGMEITILDMTGTYLFRPAPFAPKITPRKGSRMLSAIVPIPKDGPYFFRLVGPKNSISAQVDSFQDMIKSVQLE